MDPARAYVLISGRVQGVMFRESLRQEATKARVTGMVRNLHDGRVEAIFEGERSAVLRLIEWCKHGPPMARVEDVQVLWEPPRNDFSNFRIIA
ncbi:MAG: acylphosphatase [Chloroflexi bacterium]|nr:acylphosphatase [Chloroflexota bacterium]GIW09258.1 MAG: acylphosphatase [Dehalococcoidia bacterium]